jgi:hypothetical protein
MIQIVIIKSEKYSEFKKYFLSRYLVWWKKHKNTILAKLLKHTAQFTNFENSFCKWQNMNCKWEQSKFWRKICCKTWTETKVAQFPQSICYFPLNFGPHSVFEINAPSLEFVKQKCICTDLKYQQIKKNQSSNNLIFVYWMVTLAELVTFQF